MNSMMLILPVGTVIPYAGPVYKTDSGGSGDNSGNDCDPNDSLVNQQIAANLASRGWLLCDGQKLIVRDYPKLYGIIGDIYGGGEEGAEKWFKVPDYRGLFLRGTDATAERDPDVEDRYAPGDSGEKIGDTVGSMQDDAFQGHQHDYTMPVIPTVPTANSDQPATTAVISVQNNKPTTDFVKNGSDGEPRTSSETRAKNIYINFLIKAF